jgi:predicted aspartyl protease
MVSERIPSGIQDITGYKVPFKCDGLLYPVPVIYVSINGDALRAFILDTGTSLPMVIDEAVAKQIRLDFSKQDTIDSPVGPLRMANLRSVQICGIDTHNHLRFRGSPWALVGKLPAEMLKICPDRIAGIIGAPVIRGAVALFDFDNQILTLTWNTDAVSALKVRGAPLSESNRVYFVQMTVAQKAKASLLIDTGATTSSIPYDIGERFHTGKTTYGLHSTFTSGFVAQKQALLPAVIIAGHTVRNVAFFLDGEASGKSEPACLGVDILSRFNVLLDLKRRQLVLLPRARRVSHSLIQGITGVEIDMIDGEVRIVKVHQWSPARHTALQQGDRLLAVDGRRTARLPLIVTRRLLDGYAGTEARLLIQKDDGKPTTIRFQRLSQFDRPIKLRIDCDMAKRPNEPLRVLYVPSSSNMRGMLQPGDEILEVDSAPTAPMDAETLFELLTEPSQVSEITVRRRDGKMITVKIPG